MWPLWITGVLLFGGAVAAMATSGRLRRLALAVAGAGLLGTVAVYIALPTAPPAPAGLSLQVVNPPANATVTSPVVVTVCSGSAPIPGAGRLLSLSIDGRQVAEVHAGTAAIDVASGHHTLRAELVSSQHREFAPPVLTEESITVSGVGPLPSAAACPG